MQSQGTPHYGSVIGDDAGLSETSVDAEEAAMNMPSRYVYLMFHIDTNRINARQGLENMNRLEKWRADGVIALEMSERSLGEAFLGGNQDRKKKAASYIYSKTHADTLQERALLEKIEKILFPQGVTSTSQQNDAEIVFNAAKYHRTLVTNDGASRSQPGGILGNAPQLKRAVGVAVVTDEQAVEMVRKEIQERDRMARCVADCRQSALPEWVGKD